MRIVAARFAVVALLLMVAMTPSRTAPQADLVEAGRSTYQTYCERCHGRNGDSLGYPEIVPLAGITQRHSLDEIAELSAPFLGQVFRGEEAQALVAYLRTLDGEKGYNAPGWLFFPYLLDRKAGSLREHLILDVRPLTAYRKGHISNAVPWTWPAAREGCRAPAGELGQLLAEAGVSQQMFLVIYDEQGGPEAACLWWALRQVGWDRVALLDGGWQRWRAEGYAASKQKPSIRAADEPPELRSVPFDPPRSQSPTVTNLQLAVSASTSETSTYNWRATLAKEGFRPAQELRSYLDESGLTVPGRYQATGSEKELAHLVFVWHLLADVKAAYQAENKMLWLLPGTPWRSGCKPIQGWQARLGKGLVECPRDSFITAGPG